MNSSSGGFLQGALMQKQKLPSVPDIRLLIGIPSQGTFCTDTALSLALMCSDLSFPLSGKSHVFQVLNIKSSILPEGRQRLLDAALEGDATHLLFVDSDMVFPPQLARYWLGLGKDVVAANCPTRGFPCNPTARNSDGTPVYSEGKTGVEKVWRVGTGLMMVTAKALRSVPRPAFTPYWSKERDSYVGEDWAFADNLEAAGFPLWVDHMMSQTIGHIGQYTFTHDDIVEQKSELIVPQRSLVGVD
jgi:hypothetical protein